MTKAHADILTGPSIKELAHDCAAVRDGIQKIMLATRARSVQCRQGTNGLIFTVDRRGFDRLFAGMDMAITPGPAGNNEICKMVQLIPEVFFCCVYEEAPEERVIRLMEPLRPDQMADVLAYLMARVGVNE